MENQIQRKISKSITLVVEGPPVPWHRPGRNRRTNVTFQVKADEVWQAHVRVQAILHRPMILPVGAVVLDLTFWMPRPGYHLKGQEYHHTKRPDLDNLEKNIKDALSKSMYKDDCQVVQTTSRKAFVPDGHKPGAIITITYLEDQV